MTTAEDKGQAISSPEHGAAWDAFRFYSVYMLGGQMPCEAWASQPNGLANKTHVGMALKDPTLVQYFIVCGRIMPQVILVP